jgi:hypothetical protein
MGGELLQQDVRGDLKEDVWHKEDGKGGVRLVARHARVFDQAHGQGIPDVDTV